MSESEESDYGECGECGVKGPLSVIEKHFMAQHVNNQDVSLIVIEGIMISFHN